MNKLPDLEAWAIFSKVAETGSFAKTAIELALSQATVSKAITRLEHRMKVSLFHRTSRRVSLTDSGVSALERASRILQEGEALEAETMDRSSSLRGSIRMAAPMSFGIARLAPMLPEFLSAYPGVDLDIEFSDEHMDLVRDRFDVALRIANLTDSSMLARQLCKVRILLVATPAYFERYGRPTHPSDLGQHKGLQYSYSPGGTSWRFVHPELGEFTQVMPVQLQVNNAEALTPTLMAGMGLALQPEFLVWEALQSGALEVALPDWACRPIALHILTPPGRSRPARVQAFIDFLVEKFTSEPWANFPELGSLPATSRRQN